MDTKLVAQGDGNFNAVLYLNSNREVLWERLKRLVQPNLKTILGKLFFNLKFGFIIFFFKNSFSKICFQNMLFSRIKLKCFSSIFVKSCRKYEKCFENYYNIEYKCTLALRE